ncbi:hypothetical protein [Bacillus thuringiensis]|uniref:Uncharacterized protein n=2 Tax=Bacillus thuringiensis TaxID=1428 RepID=A0AAW9JCH1_BACTU|nr:hypothetical protein [Bacillus thuringiensis]MDZ5475075.1 hypothetical protein [Bacillus thuringiensis]OUB41951.1 hypothetical protein BK716_29425 [Bacillus thuringiensis serovar higo]
MNNDNNKSVAKRELIQISRSFSLSAKCNGEEETFFVTSPSFIAPNITTFMTVMNSSTTCNLIIKVKSGCEDIILTIRPGSTGNFYIKQVSEMVYSCCPIEKGCDSDTECRATVLLEAQYAISY